jgi:anti-sigma B factor antagonist
MTLTMPSRPAAPSLDVDVCDRDGTRVLRCCGEIDLSTSSRLDAAVDRFVEEGHAHLVVDLAEVTFMDSTGLNSLVRARNLLDPLGRRLSVRNVAAGPRRLFAVTRIDQVIDLA